MEGNGRGEAVGNREETLLGPRGKERGRREDGERTERRPCRDREAVGREPGGDTDCEERDGEEALPGRDRRDNNKKPPHYGCAGHIYNS